MIIIFKVRIEVNISNLFENMCKYCDSGSIFTYNKCSDRQTHRHILNCCSTTLLIIASQLKRKLFNKKKYGNWNTLSKVMTEQRLKKFLMWLCKMYLIYNHNFLCTNEGYLHEKHIQHS